jgi:hypothetical protein
MDDFNVPLLRAKDAWRLYSWLISSAGERGPATPDTLLALAEAMEGRGVEGAALTWPGALRLVARRWQAGGDASAHELHHCPQCFSRDLRIGAEITCALVEAQHDGRRFDTARPIEDPEPYWDDDSVAVCQSCHHETRVRDLHPTISAADLAAMEAINDAD